MSARRLAAVAALAIGAATLCLTVVAVLDELGRGLVIAASAIGAAGACWYGIVRRGVARLVGLGIAAALVAVAAVAFLGGDHVLEGALVLGGAAITTAAAEAAFRVRTPLPSRPAPSRPVVFWNPRSGDGRAQRVGLADEARARGIEPIELEPGADLETLVRSAVADGADAIAMAGGDGSQAIVASVAADLGLPYACIPAGTRNHFALDLGVDRDDVVGALDAFVDGGERLVDLGEVNGRVFVNNVSLGVYAEAVQRGGYRDAKLRTLLDTVPDVVGPDADPPRLSWTGPGGHEHRGGAAILVSNNRYRLGKVLGSGTRPSIDDGLLGVVAVGAPLGPPGGGRVPQRPWREWTAPEMRVNADAPVPAGIDGEAAMLEPPLNFGIRRGVLKVRVSRRHPGSSPSAREPESPWEAVRRLAAIAAGADGR